MANLLVKKIMDLINVKEIEIKIEKEFSKQYFEVNNILEKNGYFIKKSFFLGMENIYSSDHKKGKIFAKEYFKLLEKNNLPISICFFGVDRQTIKNIEKEIYEKGYSFKRSF